MENVNEKMGQDMKNVYYYPEHFGLEQVAEFECGGNYEFDTHVVWKDKQGQLYWAHDEGCSCPTPFDGYRPEDLKEITPENHREFEEVIIEKARQEKMPDHVTLRFLMQIANELREKQKNG
jgi:hypothetical protein